MANLTRCPFCDGLCLETVGICSECLRQIGTGIKVAALLVIAAFVSLLTWIMVRMYR